MITHFRSYFLLRPAVGSLRTSTTTSSSPRLRRPSSDSTRLHSPRMCKVQPPNPRKQEVIFPINKSSPPRASVCSSPEPPTHPFSSAVGESLTTGTVQSTAPEGIFSSRRINARLAPGQFQRRVIKGSSISSGYRLSVRIHGFVYRDVQRSEGQFAATRL